MRMGYLSASDAEMRSTLGLLQHRKQKWSRPQGGKNRSLLSFQRKRRYYQRDTPVAKAGGGRPLRHKSRSAIPDVSIPWFDRMQRFLRSRLLPVHRRIQRHCAEHVPRIVPVQTIRKAPGSKSVSRSGRYDLEEVLGEYGGHLPLLSQTTADARCHQTIQNPLCFLVGWAAATLSGLLQEGRV